MKNLCNPFNTIKLKSLLSQMNIFNYSLRKFSTRPENLISKVNRKQSDLSNINVVQTAVIPEKVRQINPLIRNELQSTIKKLEKADDGFEREVFYNKIDAINYLKFLDDDYDTFFKNKPLTQDNFYYYLKILSAKGNTTKMGEIIFDKMNSLGIKVTPAFFNIYLKTYADKGDIEKAENIMKKINRYFKNSAKRVSIYSSLMKAYSLNNKVDECISIVSEMKREGLEPDVQAYTILIEAHFQAGNYDKCWMLYDNLPKLNNDIVEDIKARLGHKFNKGVMPIKPLVPDEYLITTMIRIAAKTSDAEKAINLFSKMERMGYNPTTYHFNSIISALSSRKAYSSQALDMYTKMKLLKLTPDQATFAVVLKATAYLGDIYTANEILKEIKYLNIKLNEQIVVGLIKTYAGAVLLPNVGDKEIDQYIKDSWELVHYCEINDIPISSYVLNALLSVNCNSLKWDKVDNEVIPYFNKYKIKLNSYSYDLILSMLYNLRNFPAIMKVFSQLVNAEKLTPRAGALDVLLKTGIHTNNADIVLMTLRYYKETNRTPDTYILDKLTKVKDLPDSIYVELKAWNKFLPYKWERRFNEASLVHKDNKEMKPLNSNPKDRHTSKSKY